MPELPEVEVVRHGLARYISGATFDAVTVHNPRANRGQLEPLGALLRGQTVSHVARRGKFMWLEFEHEDHQDPLRDVLFIHLGMSGQIRIGDTDSKHVRLTARLHTPSGDPLTVTFIDQRTFGRWLYAPWSTMAHIAPDPLEADFDEAAAARRIRAKRGPIKSVLLDQTVLSGVGNIYADEALWAAGIHPKKRASTLRQSDALTLIRRAAEVMNRALEQGGTSFDSLYVNVNGESGYFSRSLNAYGRTGLPCHRCNTAMERIVISGRSTHLCPQCQTFKPSIRPPGGL